MTDELLSAYDVQAYIDANRIAADVIYDIGHTPTVPAAAEALGVHPDQIVKTLLFLLKTKVAPDGPVSGAMPLVVISNGTNRVDKKAIAQRYDIGKKKVRLASPDAVIDVLGYPAGGVPPFAHRNHVTNIVDQSVIDLRDRFDDVIYAGGGDDSSMMRLSVTELLRIVEPEVLPVSVT